MRTKSIRELKRASCHTFNVVCHNFQCDIVPKAYASISFAIIPIDEVCLWKLNLTFAM